VALSLVVALLALWLVALFTGHPFGGAIHLLPLVALLVVVARALRTRSR
jgi:hypothetical protein